MRQAPITIAPAAPAVFLSENAATPDSPLQLISSGALGSGRVWVGADYSVGPTSGVPLDAGSAIMWTDRQLWLVADPANTAPVTITPATAAGVWTPPPALAKSPPLDSWMANGMKFPLPQGSSKSASNGPFPMIPNAPARAWGQCLITWNLAITANIGNTSTAAQLVITDANNAFQINVGATTTLIMASAPPGTTTMANTAGVVVSVPHTAYVVGLYVNGNGIPPDATATGTVTILPTT